MEKLKIFCKELFNINDFCSTIALSIIVYIISTLICIASFTNIRNLNEANYWQTEALKRHIIQYNSTTDQLEWVDTGKKFPE